MCQHVVGGGKVRPENARVAAQIHRVSRHVFFQTKRKNFVIIAGVGMLGSVDLTRQFRCHLLRWAGESGL
jgi:protein required for attachment to host cells